jgi:hypothetical protein
VLKLEMRDFCNVAERDCIRLIVAQDLKENGIDLDSQHHSQQQQQKHQKDHTINKSNISTTHDPVNKLLILKHLIVVFKFSN